jgi:uncharacterized protein (DUF697 family)
MQESVYIPNSTFFLKRRNDMANVVIERYAKRNRFANVGIGIAGLFVPGGGILSTLVSIATQSPMVYQPMVKELSHIYGASPDMVTKGMVTDALISNTSYNLQNQFFLEFGPEFLLELLQQIWPELGIGAVTGLIPIIGGIAAAALDATFSATLTWQVGTMTAMYFMNDEEWVNSKQETRRRARKQTGLPSPSTVRPGVLAGITHNTPEIDEKIVRGVENTIRMIKEGSPEITPERLRSILKGKGIDDEFIDAGLRRVT